MANSQNKKGWIDEKRVWIPKKKGSNSGDWIKLFEADMKELCNEMTDKEIENMYHDKFKD